MSTVLTIDGAPVDLDASRVSIQRLTLSVDQPDSLEFGETGASLPFAWRNGQAVTLTIDGTLRFVGSIQGVYSGGIGEGPIAVGYRALGLKWAAGTIPITNPQDGTGVIQLNLPSTDQNFIAELSGMSVGAILKYLFDGHATALASVGITGYNAADLTPLTIVPPTQAGVLLQGSSFIDQVEYFTQNWYAQYVIYVEYQESDGAATGILRVVDSTAFTATTFTLGTDPITLDEISRDASQCFTRCVLRGFADVEPAYLSLAMATLKEAFTAADKAVWTWYDFARPGGAIDSGTITALSSNQITVQSSNPAETWATNYWNTIEAQIQLINPAATDINFTENRQITACSALAAGGTATITLDQPLVNSGYTQYYIWGQPPNVSNTWRLYDIVPAYVKDHLVKQFSHSVPWGTSSSAVVQTNFPTASICYSPNGQPPYIEWPATFEILPETGQIRFSEPVVRPFGTLPNLIKGGASTDGVPNDIKVLVAYSRGTLTAVYPPDVAGEAQFDGTAYTADKIERTLYRDYSQWRWGNDLTSYQQLAQQIWYTVSNTVVSGSLAYYGKLSSALDLGKSANIAGATTTGFEGINAAIRTVVLEYPQTGPTPWITRLSFSTVRRPFSGDALYAHPMFAHGQAFGRDDFEGLNAASIEHVAGSLAGGLGYLGGDAGKEFASGLLGDSNQLRKSLGLKEHETPRAAEPAERMEGGLEGFGGDLGEAPRRRRPKRQRPTFRGVKATPKDEYDPARYGSGPSEAAPSALEIQAARRARAAGNQHAGVNARHESDEAAPPVYAPPVVHAGPSGSSGLSSHNIRNSRAGRLAKAKFNHSARRGRHDDSDEA